MTFMDSIPGTRGLSRATWRDHTHLRGLLIKLRNENPRADRDKLLELYLAKASRTPKLIDEALRRIFDNDYTRLLQGERQEPEQHKPVIDNGPPEESPKPIRRQRRTEAASITALANIVKTVVLLDLVMPNGKKLRDCSGPDCLQFGGWLTKVGEFVGGGIVGQHLDEEGLRGFFKA